MSVSYSGLRLAQPKADSAPWLPSTTIVVSNLSRTYHLKETHSLATGARACNHSCLSRWVQGQLRLMSIELWTTILKRRSISSRKWTILALGANLRAATISQEINSLITGEPQQDQLSSISMLRETRARRRVAHYMWSLNPWVEVAHTRKDLRFFNDRTSS